MTCDCQVNINSVHISKLWVKTEEAFSTDAQEHVFANINLYQKIENHLFFVLSYFSHLFRPLATAPLNVLCYYYRLRFGIALACTNPLLEVHVNVNVALREKLVSEVKTNRDKAKKTTPECINNVFALICEETSLATLKIYFPPVKIWRVNHLKTKHNQYIDVYLDIIYLPVIQATKDLEILSLALKIIGEALLEHIYAKRIKFTICGAINLMKDFDGIAAWIETCQELPANYRDKLAKHEVLKVCEGVGKVRIIK